MKYALSALIALLSLNTYGLETIKILDGKVAHCKTKYDQYRARLGAYTFKATEVSVDDERIELSTEVKFVKCATTADGYAWESANPLDDVSYEVPDVGGTTRTITVTAKNAVLKVWRDGIYQILDEVTLAEKEEGVTLSLDLEKFLTAAEVARLDNGEEIKVALDAFLTKNVTFTGLASGDDIQTRKNFGSYRVIFKMKKNDDGSLSAKSL